MKNLHFPIFLIFMSFTSNYVLGHCQVPCGIYGDQNRFEQMLEDQSSIEKASKLINELSGKKDALSQNQLTRWVSTKEADKKYQDKLTKAHAVMVSAMKCKQTIDPQNTASLKANILAFHKAYEGKK